jgi:hypothetical protein
MDLSDHLNSCSWCLVIPDHRKEIFCPVFKFCFAILTGTMRKINTFEYILAPLAAYLCYFSRIKWLSLTCFIFIAVMIPLIFWNGLMKAEDDGKKFSVGSLVGTLILFGLQALVVWGYLNYGPFESR